MNALKTGARSQVTTAQRITLIVACLMLAVGLASYFVEYRSRELEGDAIIPLWHTVEFVVEGRAFPPGHELTPEELEENERMRGEEIVSTTGIYPRHLHNHYIAAIGGVLVPFVMITVAVFVGFGGIRKSS